MVKLEQDGDILKRDKTRAKCGFRTDGLDRTDWDPDWMIDGARRSTSTMKGRRVWGENPSFRLTGRLLLYEYLPNLRMITMITASKGSNTMMSGSGGTIRPRSRCQIHAPLYTVEEAL